MAAGPLLALHRGMRIPLAVVAFVLVACAVDAPMPEDGELETSEGSDSDSPDGEEPPSGGTVDDDVKPIGGDVDLDGDGNTDFDADELCAGAVLDTNGDGIPDAVDLNCDGTSEPICIGGAIHFDDDGIPDAIDLNCDGVADVIFEGPQNGCTHTFVDENGDGVPDGVEHECDDGGEDDGYGDGDDGPCYPRIVDADGDGWPDGIDNDCDGDIDEPL